MPLERGCGKWRMSRGRRPPRHHPRLAYLFFLTFLAHFGAILFHTLIVRDGILGWMVPWNIAPPKE